MRLRHQVFRFGSNLEWKMEKRFDDGHSGNPPPDSPQREEQGAGLHVEDRVAGHGPDSECSTHICTSE